MGWAKRRWPGLRAWQLLGLCFLAFIPADLILENGIVYYQLFNYASTVPALTLNAGKIYQFPLYEMVSWCATLMLVSAVHFFRDEYGELVLAPQILAMRVGPAVKTWFRFFAMLGLCHRRFHGWREGDRQGGSSLDQVLKLSISAPNGILPDIMPANKSGGDVLRNPVGPADTSLPLKDWTVDDLLADAVARAPHAIALKVNHLETGQIESWTYAQLQAQSRGGENIYPREIEDVLAECPGVVETAVVGVAHEKWGEEVAAAVRCEPGRIVETETLREFLYSRIARHKVPKLWKVVPDFPRTASGKIQKFEVAKWFE